jgi:hypothetical protein
MQTHACSLLLRIALAASFAVLPALAHACDRASGEDWAFEAKTPAMWPSKCGKESPMKGTVAFLWPLGSRAEQAPTFIYVTVSKKTLPTLQAYAANEQQQYLRRVPSTKVKALAESLQRKDLQIVAFEPSPTDSARSELVAYVDGPATYFIIVLTAQTPRDLELHREAFLSYASSFHPKTPQPISQRGRRFSVTSIALYQPDDVLRDRVGTDARDFARYLKALEAAAESSFASLSNADGVTGSIVVALKPGGLARFWLVLGDNKLPLGLRETLLEGLASITPISVTNGPVAAALNFDAWGGGQPILGPGEVIPIPEEWRNALVGSPPGVLPDAPLKAIWP